MSAHLDQPLWALFGLLMAFGLIMVFAPDARDAAKDLCLMLGGGLLTYIYGRAKIKTGGNP